MRLIYWYGGKNYEKALAKYLMAGAAVAGIDLVCKPAEDYRRPEADGALCFGIVRREVLWDHQAAGKAVAYLDKGFHRARKPWEGGSIPAWWRLCWNDTHPTHYLMQWKRSGDRFAQWGVTPKERKLNFTGAVVILGSSEKFHHTMKLDHPTDWAADLAASIRAMTNREIVLRPKPSWTEAVPVKGTTFDHGNKTSIVETLAGAFVTVTYGSIACVDSVIAGVPCVVLGNGVARPISSTVIRSIPLPRWPDRPEREQWLANLAYSNFSPEEIADGTAWNILKEQASYAI